MGRTEAGRRGPSPLRTPFHAFILPRERQLLKSSILSNERRVGPHMTLSTGRHVLSGSRCLQRGEFPLETTLSGLNAELGLFDSFTMMHP